MKRARAVISIICHIVMILNETQQQFIPGGIVKWGELFLIELVDVFVDESGSLVLVPHDSVKGGDIAVPRNLRRILLGGGNLQLASQLSIACIPGVAFS